MLIHMLLNNFLLLGLFSKLIVNSYATKCLMNVQHAETLVCFRGIEHATRMGLDTDLVCKCLHIFLFTDALQIMLESGHTQKLSFLSC